MEKEKIEAKDKYFYTSRPDVQKVYTTEEVAELLEVSTAIVRSIVVYNNLDQKVLPTDKGRRAYYTYDTFRQIKAIHENKLKKRNAFIKNKQNKQTETNEADADAHPLVINKRWLKLNEWPDTIPDYFKELENV